MSKLKVLYICTHNRCRSILSEAITNHFGGDKVLLVPQPAPQQ